MATATSFDMQLIAQDTNFQNRVKASLVSFCLFGGANKNFAANVLNNLNNFVSNCAWAVAVNPIVANEIITTGNANANFPSTTLVGASAVTTAIATGLVETDLNNAVGAAFNALANV